LAVRLTILGSGSRGNCAYLETDQVRLLIDAGFSGKQIRQRLATIGRTPETLNGILLTHEHSDHATGLKVIAGKLGIPLYANRLTLDAVSSQAKSTFQGKIFQTGCAFDIGDVTVETFSIPHDAQDPVGFLLRTESVSIGFLTDLGHATGMVLDRLRPANALILETNYDTQLLQADTKRPWSIKQRIMSRHGHLSNEAAAKVAEALISDHLSHIYMAHLSRDCNQPELAEKTLNQVFLQAGVNHVRLHRTEQDAPCPTLCLDASVQENPMEGPPQIAHPQNESGVVAAGAMAPAKTINPQISDSSQASSHDHDAFFRRLMNDLPPTEEDEPADAS